MLKEVNYNKYFVDYCCKIKRTDKAKDRLQAIVPSERRTKESFFSLSVFSFCFVVSTPEVYSNACTDLCKNLNFTNIHPLTCQ